MSLARVEDLPDYPGVSAEYLCYVRTVRVLVRVPLGEKKWGVEQNTVHSTVTKSTRVGRGVPCPKGCGNVAVDFTGHSHVPNEYVTQSGIYCPHCDGGEDM